MAWIAARQRGLVTTVQLHAVGISESGISRRVASGRLHRVHRGVYLVGHAVAPPLAMELAAVLACGPAAVLSHRPAAVLAGFMTPGEGPIDVTVAGADRRRHGVRLHRARGLLECDVIVLHGIPVTSPARTLLDLADDLPSRPFQRAFEEAERMGLVTRPEIDELLRRSPGRHGAPRLASLLADGSEPALTRSEAEERMLALIRKGGLPPPRVNAKAAGHEVDFLWPDHGLVVEVDGYAFHSGRAAFERDRLRDADLAASGLRVVRTSWRRLTSEPEAALVRVAQALAAYTRPR